jgi:drug/metabolite transporter (DMT)-like permease
MSFVWTAIVLEAYPPVTVIFLRLLISCVFLFLFVYITGRIQRIRKEDFWLFLGSALFNPFFYFIGENYGVLLTSPTISAVIIATIPLFAPIAAFFYLRERLNILNISGLLISFSGILIMLLGPDLSIQTSPLGVLALMFAVFSAVAYSIFLKKLTARYSSVFIIAVQNLLGYSIFHLFFSHLNGITFYPQHLHFRLCLRSLRWLCCVHPWRLFYLRWLCANWSGQIQCFCKSDSGFYRSIFFYGHR